MPLSAAAKSKNKPRESRRSRSRNTTPSSVLSAGTAPSGPTVTPYLELDTSKLLVTSYPQYADALERLESRPSSSSPKQLQDIIDQLRSLSDSAEKRAESCERAIRQLHETLREVEADQKERDQQAEQARKAKAKKEVADTSKSGKARKRKDRVEAFDGVEVKREDDVGKPKFHRALDTPGPVDSPSPSKKAKLSPGTSSLSEVADSPDNAQDLPTKASPPASDVSMDEPEENKIIHRQPAMPQQGFFPDPLAPDPVTYHIREVTPGMSNEEKKEIYSVAAFPTKDLSDQIAGTPPDKDFSNAKPTNQVAANTFLTYVEPYLRPLMEEDIAFLKERGDRVTPFLAVPRENINYLQKWAREDSTTAMDSRSDTLPANQGRGGVDQISDDNAHTDQVSTGPLASRLLSLLRFEHRSLPSEANNTANDFSFMNGDGNEAMDLDGLTNGHDITGERPVPPAGAVAELTGSKTTQHQKLEYAQADERIKMELRHLNLLGQDENPDYDSHHDDDISERLRLLQAELRRVVIVNGARKARLYDLAKERMAFQEYMTIHEDLDSQVQQAYLKRTRTMGKAKKGGPGGGSKPKAGTHVKEVGGKAVSNARDIGENARMLMDRRRRWEDCIGPVFKDVKIKVPTEGETIWDSKAMEAYERSELEGLEDETGE